MFFLGTIVNAVAIVVGSAVGIFLPNIPVRMRNTIMQALALCVILIGIDMALTDAKDILIIIISMVLGTLIGESLNIEEWLLRIGALIEGKVQRFHKGPIAEAFVAASLLFCVGSLSIVGSIQSGMQGDNQTLFAKSILDGFSSIIFTSTLGIGTILAVVPVVLYEGFITLVSHWAGAKLNDPAVIACMTATGGLMIVAIGLNVYGLKKIAVGNLLPALVFAALLKWIAPIVNTQVHGIFH